MASLGGKREGAGRPKGAINKFKLRERFTDEEVMELVSEAKEQAKKDPVMLKFLLEQIFGKARQSVGFGGDEENSPIKMIYSLEQELKNWSKS
ncbi:MAG: hypothetical protein COW50_03795 [Candidatus Moranbacteria bacterium CG17_big_fil_post_rev_8_21_14_2_50_41_107]|nr:MAG: hypothetical protein COW50_03795 [Candidatus Moranbacteria bacterium CG17_big_fil_post_rev_8_21_14_2_50_41_107]